MIINIIGLDDMNPFRIGLNPVLNLSKGNIYNDSELPE